MKVAQAAEIVKEFTFLLPKHRIHGPSWDIAGKFMEHDYEITQAGRPIVTIQKEWMTWGDSYQLDISDPADEVLALAGVLTIDAVTESSGGVSATGSGD